MTIPEILKELEPYTGRFPMKAMRAAIEQREAITPELLRVVAAAAENPEQYAHREDRMLHHLALYLLSQFREQRAYPSIVKMFSAPGETDLPSNCSTALRRSANGTAGLSTARVSRSSRASPAAATRSRCHASTDPPLTASWKAASA